VGLVAGHERLRPAERLADPVERRPEVVVGFELDGTVDFVPDDPEEYRQKRAVETWHFCSNCSNWPGWNYRVSYEKPSSGKLCNECQAKRSDGTCSN
jgi:hypothetical protein